VEPTAEPFPELPSPLLQRFGLWLHRLLRAASDAVVPAQLAIFERSFGAGTTQLLGLVARHRIADRLVDGPLTAAELARPTALNADVLHRMLRALASGGVFRLRDDGRFEHSRLSRALCSGQLQRTREWCEYFASGSNVASWSALEETARTGAGAFRRVHGASVWSWFDTHPEEREIFAQAMMGITVSQAPLIATLYPFQELTTVCDVGGGRGALLSELLVRHPHLQGVLVDGEGVLDSAKALLERRGVSARVRCVAGSFFEQLPPGADAYLLKNVLHDWDDARCRQILGVCRAAMVPGQRLLVVETVTEPLDTRGFGPLSDVQMMVVCDEGRERGVRDYTTLLEQGGFRPGRVFGSPVVSVLEGVAVQP
jgi:hypothetical protein